MNGQKEILIRRGPNHVRSGQKLPRQDGSLTKQVRTGNLKGDDGEDEVFGQRFGTAQLGYLGPSVAVRHTMSFERFCAPQGVL